jgi:ABC-type glycerol-3-phosphate transport system substrate-binding protein
MIKNRFLLLSSVVMLSSVALFAQGSKEAKTSSQDTTKGSEPVTISYYAWNDASHQAMVDEFNRTHTDVQVDAHILASADYETKIATLLSGRADIDAFMEKRQTDMFN